MRPTTRVRALRYVALALLVAWPWFHLPTSLLGNANTAGVYLLVAVSLVILTGWVGQVSLAQASFVGIGAYITALVTRGWHLGFPFNLAVGALCASAAAAALGLVALRVRGLYLAVATLIFAWVTDAYVFTATWMGGTGGSTSAPIRRVGSPGHFPYVDFGDRRTFYYVTLAACALAIFAAVNIRDSKIGRALFAVRGSEIAAASFGIDVVRTKLVAFAIAGFIAGVAGSLLIVQQGSAVADQFNLSASLFFLSIAVVGGLSSVGGAVAASVLFAGLNELFFRVQALAGYLDVVSAGLLAAVLLLYPGGMAAFGESVAAATRRWSNRRRDGADDTEDGIDGDVATALVPSGRARVAPPDGRAAGRVEGAPVLAARDITVRFGGLTAVDNVTLEVRAGEIVGLIGPNGAGKTTLFNAISGLNRPTTGTVAIGGVDATAALVHARARLGLARTFQVLQLFPQLDVFDNLLVGTHLESRNGVLSRVALTRGAIEAELDAGARVQEVIDLLGLNDVAHHGVSGLPFGTLRMVELARALVTKAPVIMLDEPASGLDNAETDGLSAILRRLRAEFGVSLLVIEHDVRMVTALTDYMYVIDRGQLIAEGTPAEIQRNEAVIAAYLGTAAQPVGASA